MRLGRPGFVLCSALVALLGGTSSAKSSTTTAEGSQGSSSAPAASTSSSSPNDEPSASVPTVSSGETAKVVTPASGSPGEAKPASASSAEKPKPENESLPIWVEHLGPSSYPGKLRGLYGGSLWLEPSFHGLQWPTMAKSGVGVSDRP
jgi:hypothetical protein